MTLPSPHRDFTAEEPAGDIPPPLRGPRSSEHGRRVSELIDANSREVIRRRTAEARHLRECLLSRLAERLDAREAERRAAWALK